MAIWRLSGFVKSQRNFALIGSSVGGMTVITDSDTSEPMNIVEAKVIDNEDSIELDVVFSDADHNPQNIINTLTSFVGSDDCNLTIHECKHPRYGGSGGPCPAPVYSLIQGESG